MIVQFNNNNKLVLSSSNFQFVDEFGKEVWSYNVKDHYQYLLEFVSNNQILNLRNYINQFEGFGKSSLYLGLYKSKVLKEKFVYETIKNEDLEGDLIINLFCLLKGELALNSECLIHFTVGNPKFYTNEVVKTKLINLIFLKINYLKINTLFNKWNGYFSKMRKIIINSELPIYLRVYLITLIFRRRLLFYYDLVTCNIDSWPFNIFYRIKRKFTLE